MGGGTQSRWQAETLRCSSGKQRVHLWLVHPDKIDAHYRCEHQSSQEKQRMKYRGNSGEGSRLAAGHRVSGACGLYASERSDNWRWFEFERTR